MPYTKTIWNVVRAAQGIEPSNESIFVCDARILFLVRYWFEYILIRSRKTEESPTVFFLCFCKAKKIYQATSLTVISEQSHKKIYRWRNYTNLTFNKCFMCADNKMFWGLRRRTAERSLIVAELNPHSILLQSVLHNANTTPHPRQYSSFEDDFRRGINLLNIHEHKVEMRWKKRFSAQKVS